LDDPGVFMKNTMVSLILLLTCSCSEDYIQNRAMDFTDIFDASIGGPGFGLGARIQLTDFYGHGLGFGYYTKRYEKYGRQYLDESEYKSYQLYYFSIDGTGELFAEEYKHSSLRVGLFGVNWAEYMHYVDRMYESRQKRSRVLDKRRAMSVLSRLRVGGEIYCPIFSLGFFFNIGEFIDFILGFAGIDIMEDDK
jgi:hypothetical protein